MGIVPTFHNGAVKFTVSEYQTRVDSAAVFVFSEMGEELVNYAKDKHNYTDRTGNLTNSITWFVVCNKRIVAKGSGNEVSGNVTKDIVTKMTEEITSKYALIIAAGMNYAAYVEAKGYNVILPAELKARIDFPKAIKRIEERAIMKAQQIFKDIVW